VHENCLSIFTGQWMSSKSLCFGRRHLAKSTAHRGTSIDEKPFRDALELLSVDDVLLPQGLSPDATHIVRTVRAWTSASGVVGAFGQAADQGPARGGGSVRCKN
jgi:hypothetical protein